MAREQTKAKVGIDAPADELVRNEWLRRIEAEYRSAVLTQNLTLWLMQLGGPPDLIALGLRIVGDELAHAELSAAIYRAAGGSSAPQLARETLGLARRPDRSLEQDLLRAAVEHFCLGETVAVRLFHRLRKQGRVPIVARALRRILRDEAVHRDFGWALLEWLLTTPLASAFRRQLAEELPGLLQQVHDNYGGAALSELGREQLEARAAALSDSARAWGLMPASDYLEAVEETIVRDYRPRFSALGVEVVWQSGHERQRV